MKLTTKSTYGLRALMSLARRYPEAVALSEIARQEKISPKYLEAIFAKLKQAGIIVSTKGSAGGYALAKAPDKISLWQILSPLEPDLPTAHCVTANTKTICSGKCSCGVGKVMDRLSLAISREFKKTTLKSIC